MSYTFKKVSYPVRKAEIRKSAAEAEVLRKLRAYLDVEEPKLVYFLVNLWRSQGRAVTFKELREAILAGDLNAELLEEWRQDYAKFVVDHLQPAWLDAMVAAVEALDQKYPEWHFDPMADGVREWTENRAAEFVVDISQNQMMAIRSVVQAASVLNEMNVDQLARAIRPMVGLYPAQARANWNYYRNLIENGVKEKKALDLSVRYSARQIRYRSYNIARTELCYSYNKGAYEGIKQAQAAGYMGEVVKVWSTSLDERTCKYCGALEGKVIAIDEEFDFKTRLIGRDPKIRLTPPAHPSCRCAVLYIEKATLEQDKKTRDAAIASLLN